MFAQPASATSIERTTSVHEAARHAFRVVWCFQVLGARRFAILIDVLLKKQGEPKK
jgi:hypothetical protein